MISKYLKSSLRIIRRQKSVSFIILTGLSVGLASSFLIMGFLKTELTYDRFHTHGDHIYRIIAHDTLHHTYVPWGPFVLGNTIREEIPGVKEVVPLYFTENFTYRTAGKENGPAYEYSEGARMLCADSGFFRIFSFPVKAGRSGEIFSGPESSRFRKPGPEALRRRPSHRTDPDNTIEGRNLFPGSPGCI